MCLLMRRGVREQQFNSKCAPPAASGAAPFQLYRHRAGRLRGRENARWIAGARASLRTRSNAAAVSNP